MVLVLPVAAGAIAAVLLLVIAMPPLLLKLQQRRQAIKTLEIQQASLPELRRKLADGQVHVQNKQQQHQRLLALVAGTGQLPTWLSGLNDLAAATGVSVTQVEPGPLENYTPPPSADQKDQPSASSSPPAASAGVADPLLAPGLQKRSATLTLRGTYQDMRRFLQRLEALQVIAIASDLDLKGIAAASGGAGPSGGAKPGQIELKLKLSAYGRAPAAASSAGSAAAPGAPQS